MKRRTSFVDPTFDVGQFAKGFLDGWGAIGGVILLGLYLGLGLSLAGLGVYLTYQSVAEEIEASQRSSTHFKSDIGRIQQAGEEK